MDPTSPTFRKRFKYTEREEQDSMTEPGQEFGGLECPIEDVITVSYVREQGDLEDIETLVQYALLGPKSN